MKRRRILWLGIALLATVGVLILGWAGVTLAWAAEMPAAGVFQTTDELPSRNWRVCRDLGIGRIPGVGERQRFKLCHPSGYAVRAYCMNPGQPVPNLGTTCTLRSDDTFYCGSTVQLLKLYAIVAAPAATETPVPTVISTPTSTPVGQQPTPVPRGRENRRPRPGGGSNAWLAGGIALTGGAGLLLGGVWLTLFAMQRKPPVLKGK